MGGGPATGVWQQRSPKPNGQSQQLRQQEQSGPHVTGYTGPTVGLPWPRQPVSLQRQLSANVPW
jgi:hypothetical protein